MRVNWGSLSIFHQHSHTILKYCSHVKYESVHKLGSLWWEIGDSRKAIELVSLPIHYEKSTNLHLQKFIGKSYKPLLNQNNLSPCLSHSLSYTTDTSHT